MQRTMNTPVPGDRSVSRRSANDVPVAIVGVVLAAGLGSLAANSAVLALGGALLVLAVAIVWPRPILVAYGLTLILPLTGGLARGAVIPFLRGGQLAVVLGCLLFLLARPGPLGKSRFTAIDFAFVFYVLAGSVFPLLALYARGESVNLGDTSGLYGVTPLQTLLGPFQYYLLYRVVVASLSSVSQVTVILKLSFIASIIVAVLGILEEFVEPVRTFILTYYPPPEVQGNLRISSTLQFYNGLAAYLTFTIIMALVCYTDQKRLRMPSLLLGTTMLLDAVALVLTGTLAAWIGLAIGTAFIFVVLRRISSRLFLVLAGIVIALMLFQPFIAVRLDQQLGAGAAQGLVPQSLAFRMMLWRDIFLPVASQNLVFGAGPAPTVLAAWPTEEMQYLRLLLRGGLLAVASYILLMVVAFAACRRRMRDRGEHTGRLVAIGILAMLVALQFMNISGEYFTFAGPTQTLWTLLALVVGLEQLPASRGDTASVVQAIPEPAAAAHTMRSSFAE